MQFSCKKHIFPQKIADLRLFTVFAKRKAPKGLLSSFSCTKKDVKTIITEPTLDYRAYFASHVKKMRVHGAQAIGLCPFHGDAHPSLSMNLERGLFKCHACNKSGNVVQFQALLDGTDTKTAYRKLFPKPSRYDDTVSSHRQNAKETIYPYTDQDGIVLYELVRIDSGKTKKYYYRHTPPGADAPIRKKPETRVPYYLPGLLAANKTGGTLFLVEGEKCAQSLIDLGALATTTGSAASFMEWTDVHTAAVENFDVLLLPDYDAPGRHYMQELAKRLTGKVHSLRLLELWTVFPNMKAKDDIADLLDRGVTIAELLAAAENAPPPDSSLNDALLLEYPLNDLGNAGRLMALEGSHMRYCHDHGKWYCWDGGRWKADTNGEAQRKAANLAERFQAASKESTQAVQRFALQCGNVNRLEAMLQAATALNQIDSDRLDANDDLICTGETTIELETATLRQSHPRDWITRKAAPITDDTQNCPLFMRFLDRIFGYDQKLIDYIQRALGYTMTGSTKEQVFFIAWGDGANGKSTLMNIISHILGEYAQPIPIEAITGISHGNASPELAGIAGARLVTVHESGSACRLNEGLIKQLTGSDPVFARPLYSQGFYYRPHFKIWLSTNHKPLIAGNDNGIWRRVHLIPFNVRIPKEEMDKDLYGKLQAEAGGIFRWLCEGAKLWYQNGLQPPEVVLNAVEDYQSEMDKIDEFFAQCILRQPESMISANALYIAYEQYCNRQHVPAKSQTFFGKRVTNMGIEKVKNSGVYYIGLKYEA